MADRVDLVSSGLLRRDGHAGSYVTRLTDTMIVKFKLPQCAIIANPVAESGLEISTPHAMSKSFSALLQPTDLAIDPPLQLLGTPEVDLS